MKEYKKVGFFSYLVSIFSFLPLFGILFIIGTFAYGLAKRKEGGIKLIVISIIGIIYQIVLLIVFVNFMFIGQDIMWNISRYESTKENLARTVKNIEIYKRHHKVYPNSLMELEKFNKNEDKEVNFLYEPVSFNKTLKEQFLNHKFFQYKLIEQENYYLYSIGLDNHDNTDDDIYLDKKPFNSGYVDFRQLK